MAEVDDLPNVDRRMFPVRVINRRDCERLLAITKPGGLGDIRSGVLEGCQPISGLGLDKTTPKYVVSVNCGEIYGWDF